MAKKKEKNTMSPRDAESITPIIESMYTGNYVKGNCQHAGTYDPIAPANLCKNWNGKHEQLEQPCPVSEADSQSCPFLVKTKRRDPLV